MTITNTDNTINVSDIKDRVKELEESIFNSDNELEELATLNTLLEDLSDYNEDATLIHADHFADYARELCRDLGYINNDSEGTIVIDWDATTDNLLIDYNDIDFDGQVYHVRG